MGPVGVLVVTHFGTTWVVTVRSRRCGVLSRMLAPTRFGSSRRGCWRVEVRNGAVEGGTIRADQTGPPGRRLSICELARRITCTAARCARRSTTRSHHRASRSGGRIAEAPFHAQAVVGVQRRRGPFHPTGNPGLRWATGAYMDAGEPIVLLGDSSAGKSHLLIALRLPAREQGRLDNRADP